MGEHQKVFNALFHQPAQMRRFFLPEIQVFINNILIYNGFHCEILARGLPRVTHDLKHCLPVISTPFFV